MTALLTPVRTHVGHAGYDDHQFCGYSLFHELRGEETYTGMVALAVTRRRFDAREVQILDDLTVVTSAAEPRIWPLKLARITASYGNVLGGVAAGLQCLEGAAIGPWNCGDAAIWLADVADRAAAEAHRPPREVAQAFVREALAAGRALPGFGVPFRPVDERLRALREILERRLGKLGLYWELVDGCADVMRDAKRLEPNIAMGVAATCLALRVDRHQVGALMTALAVHQFFANAVEGEQQREGQLRSLDPRVARYVGVEPRRSPRALGSSRG